MSWRLSATWLLAAMLLPLLMAVADEAPSTSQELAREHWRLEVLLTRARSQLDANKVSDALQSCFRAKDICLWDARIESLLGEAYLRQGKWGQAVLALRDATGSERDKGMLAQAATELGWERRQARGLEDALRLWREAVEADSLNVWAHSSLGLGYLADGELKAAELHCRLATELAADWSGGWGNLALVLCAKPDLPAAEHALSKVLELSPNDPSALNNMAFLKYEQNQIREAIALWEKLAEGGNASADQLAGLAIGYLAAGQQDKALSVYKDAVAADASYLEPENLASRHYWSERAVSAAAELLAAINAR